MSRLAIVAAILVSLAIGLSCTRLGHHGPLTLSGTLELTEHGLGAPVPGRLQTLHVDEGDRVSRGQLLATLERYEQAKRDYERLNNLLREGGTTQQAVELAALALADQQISSPVDGVILLKIHEPGEVVVAGSPVLVIGDRSHLWVKVYVPEGQINRLRLNQPATLRFDGISKTFQGHVSYIAPRAEFTPRNVQTPEERVTQTFAVKVALDEADPSLRPGVAANVQLSLGQER